MPLFTKFRKKGEGESAVTFPPVLKTKVREEGPYAVWVRNHLWNEKNERWCRRIMETFAYRPTIGILMQSTNPRPEFLREAFASIFHQVYPFHELMVVDRGSVDPAIRELIEYVEKDPRVTVSFQKGNVRDEEAIAKIMKKAESEWLLLMGAEDVLEPNALYNMVAVLQTNQEADFVFADSDLLDEEGLRYAPQFKPEWAVGSYYPLGYYQHPVLMCERLVAKLRGHERISQYMEQGVLLDEASNHSRWVAKAPGVLYHARARGLKNETPPAPVNNVLMNEEYVVIGDRIEIHQESRIRTEPKTPLQILWLLDSLELQDAEMNLFQMARYLSVNSRHHFSIFSTQDGPLRKAYEKLGTVTIGYPEATTNVDVIFAGMLKSTGSPLPPQWTAPLASYIAVKSDHVDFDRPATVIFPNADIAAHYASLDQRKISRILIPSVELDEIKLYKQQTSPLDVRAHLGVSRNAFVASLFGPASEEKGQSLFVSAALRLLQKFSDQEIHFFLVGATGGGYMNEVREMIRENQATDRIHVIPEISSPSDRYPYFWASDAIVSCATREIFPLPLLQGMAFKKAVIATGIAAHINLIQNGENGFLFAPGSWNELAAHLEELIRKRDLAEALGRTGYEWSLEKWHVKKIATRLETLLRESIVA